MKPYGRLLGRDVELAAALRILHHARTHGASGVVAISGGPGMGKTAMLTVLARHGSHLGMRVTRAACDPIGSGWPGASVVGMLRWGRQPLLSAEDYAAVVALQPEPALLVDRVIDHLERACASAPVLMLIDDVHLADPVTRYAVRASVSRLVGLPIVWVVTGRSGDDVAMVAAADVVDVERFELRPLTAPDAVAMAAARLGFQPTDHVRGLLAAAAGNPFLITRIIDGVTRHPGSPEAVVPAEFRDAVRIQVTELPATGRALVELIAVAGRPLTVLEAPQLLAGAGEPSTGLEAAMTALQAGTLVSGDGLVVAMAHSLIRDVVCDSMPASRQRWLHALLARHAQDVGDVAAVAAHSRAALTYGDDIHAAMLLAAAEALATTSPQNAADDALHAFRALRPEHPTWLDSGRRALATLSVTQRAAGAIEVADRLLAATDDLDVVAAVETDTARALWLTGRFSQMAARAERCAVMLAERPALVSRFRAVQALARTRLSSAEDAAAEACEALEAARRVGDPAALQFGLWAAGHAANAQARHHVALKHFRELRTVTSASYLAEEILELQLLDRYDHAQMLLDEGLARSVVPDLLFAQMKQDYNLGRLAEADAVATELIDLGQAVGTPLHVIEGHLIRTAVALLRGEIALAAARLVPAAALASHGDARGHPGVVLMRGWLTTMQGDLPGAMTILGPMLAQDHESRNYWTWWPCWTTVFLRIGSAVRDVEFTTRTVELAMTAAEHNPGVPTLTGLALHVQGMLNRDTALVGEAAEVLAGSPRTAFRASVAENYGRLLLSSGDHDHGIVQLDRAWDEYDRMGAWAHRAIVQHRMRKAGVRRAKWADAASGDTDSALTDAERRVAYLVADGHTNKATAKNLGVSVNTVGAHLRSVYAKLGVRSRVQLTNALRERGELP